MEQIGNTIFIAWVDAKRVLKGGGSDSFAVCGPSAFGGAQDFIAVKIAVGNGREDIQLKVLSAVIGDDREDKTLVYLSVRPISRWSLYLAKVLGSIPLALGIALGAFFGICVTASICGGLSLPLGKIAGIFLPTIILGTLAYLTFFGWLGAVFRNATLIGIAHVFLVELFMSQTPGVLKRISISFYVRCMLYDAGEAYGVGPRNKVVFQPVEGGDAAMALVAIAVGFLLLGMFWFSRHEYRDLT